MKEGTKPESSEARRAEPTMIDLLSGWMQQGLGSFFTTQRIILDLLMRQNANAMHIARERLAGAGNAAEMLTEMAGEGMSNFIRAQKVLLMLARQQNEIVMTGVKERVGGFAPVTAMTDMMRRSLDTFIDMQHEFLNVAERQTQSWLEGKPYRDGMMDLAGQALENFVRAQKKFLDVVAEETANATDGKHGEPKKMRKTELTELARQATESFVDAQKKLLDLAGRQMHTTVGVAGKAVEMLNPVKLLPWAELTREGVKSFVDAEKTLLDVMLKQKTTTHADTMPKTRRTGPRPIPRARKKQTRAKAATA
jgi:hypothetical protein